MIPVLICLTASLNLMLGHRPGIRILLFFDSFLIALRKMKEATDNESVFTF